MVSLVYLQRRLQRSLKLQQPSSVSSEVLLQLLDALHGNVILQSQPTVVAWHGIRVAVA